MKTNNTSLEEKSKGIGVRKKTKKSKQYKLNWASQNNERKFYQLIEEESSKTYHQVNVKEAKQFWNKIWKQKENGRKAEWINNMEKALQGPEENSKAEIHLHLFKATLKKVPNWKHQAMLAYHEFLVLKIQFNPRQTLAIEMNKCLEEINILEWVTKRKTTLNQKDTQKGTNNINYRPKICFLMVQKIQTAQLREEIHYCENSVPQKSERMPQGNKRNRRSIIHWATHLQAE